MLNERQVKVDRGDLLKDVKANKERHVKEYEQAVTDYADATKRCIQDLHRMIKKDPTGFSHHEAFNNLHKPRSYEREYEKVIRILECSVDEEVTISFEQHERWVLDEWHWKGDFQTNSTTLAQYKLKGRRV